jgi:hypothetical protein
MRADEHRRALGFLTIAETDALADLDVRILDPGSTLISRSAVLGASTGVSTNEGRQLLARRSWERFRLARCVLTVAWAAVRKTIAAFSIQRLLSGSGAGDCL